MRNTFVTGMGHVMLMALDVAYLMNLMKIQDHGAEYFFQLISYPELHIANFIRQEGVAHK